MITAGRRRVCSSSSHFFRFLLSFDLFTQVVFSIFSSNASSQKLSFLQLTFHSNKVFDREHFILPSTTNHLDNFHFNRLCLWNFNTLYVSLYSIIANFLYTIISTIVFLIPFQLSLSLKFIFPHISFQKSPIISNHFYNKSDFFDIFLEIVVLLKLF